MWCVEGVLRWEGRGDGGLNKIKEVGHIIYLSLIKLDL